MNSKTVTRLIKPQKVQQDEERLNFVRNMPCLIREYGLRDNFPHVDACASKWDRAELILRNEVPCEAHHVRKGTHTGASRKPPADRTVPLCKWSHDEYHVIGHATFCAKYGLNLEEHLARINAEYDALHPKNIVLASFKLKPVRKRKQKATLHIQFCKACSQSHEIPWRKYDREKSVFWCINANAETEVP